MRQSLKLLVLLAGVCCWAGPARASPLQQCRQQCARQHPAPTVRYALAVEGGAGVGTYNPYGIGRLAFEALFWQRLELALNLRTNISGQLTVIGPALRIGLLLRPGEPLQLLVAGEAGYGAMQLYLPLGSPWVHQAVFRSLLELRVALPAFASWELRATPLAVTAFFSRVWGLVYEPSASVAYLF